MSGRVDLAELVEPCDAQRFVDASLWPDLAWPEWTEADEAALTETLIAADPALRSEPPAAEVVADAETAPLDRALLGRLAAVDVDELDDAGLVSFAVAWTRVSNHAAAQVARAVARFRSRIDPGEALSASALTAAEFGVALGLGAGGADLLVATSAALATRLPDTLAALDRGEVSWPKAIALVERTAGLTPELARRVEQVVLPAAASRTPARHAEAIRRAVDRIDPGGAAERRRRAQADIALIRTHVGDGMGELFARLPSEDLDAIWTGADTWARRAKAAGDIRTLDQLRVAALVRWATSFLSHGDSTVCDDICESLVGPVEAGGIHGSTGDPEPVGAVATSGAGARPPTRHGRRVAVRVVWDVRSLLGLADDPGELADSGATLSAETIRELIADGVELRRLLVDEATGELLDLTARGFSLPPRTGTAHGGPVELHVVMSTAEWDALQTGADSQLATAVDAAAPMIGAMLAAPLTAAELEHWPDAYPAPAALADFIATRDRHPTNPGAGLSAAHASDLDHVVAVRDGGKTVRENLTTPTRRWHRLRTLGGWTVRRVGRGWQWTSPLGRTITTRPYDYRLRL